MAATIRSVEPIVVALPREVPYLGPLGPGERVNERGYFVRAGNRTIYPVFDRSVLVRITSTDGTFGWGETYGIVAPQAVVAIIEDVLAPRLVGREPDDIAALWDELYALMRVRGHWGGFFNDALARLRAPRRRAARPHPGIRVGVATHDLGPARGAGTRALRARV